MQSKNLKYRYDRDSDVLYAFIDKPTPATSIEKDNGTLIRVDPKTGKVVGFTIIDYMYRIKTGLLKSVPEFKDVELPQY